MWNKQPHCASLFVSPIVSDNDGNDSEIKHINFDGSDDECVEDKEELTEVDISNISDSGGVPRVDFMHI